MVMVSEYAAVARSVKKIMVGTAPDFAVEHGSEVRG
jgi:hypothetical protein